MRTVTIIFRNDKKECTHPLTTKSASFWDAESCQGFERNYLFDRKLSFDTQCIVLPSPPVRVQPVSRIA